MTKEEALHRFEGDLEMLKVVCAHQTNQMDMYEVAIICIKESIERELEKFKG